MQKFTADDLNAMTQHQVSNIASQMGLKTHVLVKIRSGQPHKRISASKPELIQRILNKQA